MSAKPIDLRSLTGLLDARSSPDQLALGAWRYVLNFGVTDKNKLCRVPGWSKLLDRESYNNQDLHKKPAEDGAITMLAEVISTRKTTKLIAGTSRRLLSLNNGTGNWKVLKSNAADVRWRKPAALRDTVIFTNRSDPPMSWQFDQGAVGGDLLSTIPDLETIGISKAAIVITFSDHVFLMNVVEQGAVKANRVYWCNYQKALSWIPSEESTAGNLDLDDGETILAAEVLGERLIIYTTFGIWEIVPTGTTGGSPFSRHKRYDSPKGENCLFYPNTLVSVGNLHFYAGKDGIYEYNLFQDKPQRIEWMHRSSSLMFGQIDESQCDLQIAGYHYERKELLFSYAKKGDTKATETLVFNVEYPFAYVLDHGFSAMAGYTLKEPVLIVRDFLVGRCICSKADFETFWGDLGDEGENCAGDSLTDCGAIPVNIYSGDSMDVGDGVLSENFDAASADADSLCALLDGVTLRQLCESESREDECNSGRRFVVASTVDDCLKELSTSYYRERYTGLATNGCGAYTLDGYRSVLRTGAISLNDSRNDKVAERVEVEADAVPSSSPGQLRLKVGMHSQAVDPNSDAACQIIWEEQDAKDLQCLSGNTAAGHNSAATLPDQVFDWETYYAARFLYFEVAVDNVANINRGAACCLSRMTLDVKASVRSY